MPHLGPVTTTSLATRPVSTGNNAIVKTERIVQVPYSCGTSTIQFAVLVWNQYNTICRVLSAQTESRETYS
jgi:hypothetical protein